jgi:dihydrofolate synthase/folylpolyglutamate synthase
MQYREAIDWLFSTQMFGFKLGLEGPRLLLREYLAFPAHNVTVIQVAGTNGKGSTCAMIDRIARAAGRRSGLFTSPHLIDYRERIQVSGRQIPEENCAAMLTDLREICAAMDPHPTFFEITLVLAMRWFRDCGCELIVLETGMGGRLDATTAVPADVSVITHIGMDHMQWLGDTIDKIAAEKAGIFRHGKPAVCAPQDPAARAVLKKSANEARAPLAFIEKPMTGYHIALAGEHQQWNAALAVAALHHAGVPLDADIVREGLAMVCWPGRFEEIMPNVILDGAHNPHAAAVLAATWRERFGHQKAALVFSAVAAKDIAGILAELAPLAAEIYICAVDTPRAVTPLEIAGHLPASAPPHQCHERFPEAFAAARASGLPVLVAGSLFLAGEARAFLTGAVFQGCSQ